MPGELEPRNESGLLEGKEVDRPKEIERKYLVKSLPDNLEDLDHAEIDQGYLAITPDGTEVRLRRKGEKFYQTVKSGSGKSRFESEIQITPEQFQALWEATSGKRIAKTRYHIPHEDRLLELDVYHGSLDGLTSVEVEFPDEEASEKFVPPEWFGEEVTEDSRYKNQQLALAGIPRTEPEHQE
ncbi:MAG: CYTH domain-containing protein [Patescibacteria group bacterium]